MNYQQRDMFNKRFDGADYKDKRDRPRLTGQLKRIWAYMLDGNWYTLRSIAEGVKAPESSVSGQMRNLRKPLFGRHTIEKEKIGGGLYHYRLVRNVHSE